MGFYHPATIVKDAQRHGLKVRPVDVTRSDWQCTLEQEESDGKVSLRMGLRYVRGVREEAGHAVVSERLQRPFTSVDDLARRVPELRRNELNMLAQIGALNGIAGLFNDQRGTDESSTPVPHAAFHRRDALWAAGRAAWSEGPLLRELSQPDSSSPLQQMTAEERLIADYHGTGLTVGPHPMLYRRAEMDGMKVVRAIDLRRFKHGQFTRIAGCVIARQRPGTANGFIFLSLEDETGISNAIITPDLYDQNRLLVIHERFLLIEGILQNVENVISVKAMTVSRLEITEAATRSHDFH
jgi:error-prone DNA polymerase